MTVTVIDIQLFAITVITDIGFRLIYKRKIRHWRDGINSPINFVGIYT